MMPMNHRLMRPTRKGPTVPGRPTVTFASDTNNDGRVEAAWTTPATGGSPLTGFRVYLDGALLGAVAVLPASGWSASATFEADPGNIVQIAAVNAVGEGPKSAPFGVTS